MKKQTVKRISRRNDDMFFPVGWRDTVVKYINGLPYHVNSSAQYSDFVKAKKYIMENLAPSYAYAEVCRMLDERVYRNRLVR